LKSVFGARSRQAKAVAIDRLMMMLIIGAEPIPYIARDAIKQALLDGPKLSRDVFWNEATTKIWTPTSLELMTLPVCIQFARTLGARSVAGRRLLVADSRFSTSQSSRRAIVRTRSVSASAPPADDDRIADDDNEDPSELPTIPRCKRVDSSVV